MNIIHAGDLEWAGYAGHRGSGISSKRLFSGDEGSRDNFEFLLARVESRYTTPRHRHNFDQMRFTLAGSFGYGNGRLQSEGTVGYFPEGCFYEQDAEGASCTLLLQTSGASAAPYLSSVRAREVTEELERHGAFEAGVYRSDRNGKKVNQDAYEAIWEYATGQSLEYPKPRFEHPVVMNPKHFSYVGVQGEPGVSRKQLGRFGERELEVGFLAMEAGSKHRPLDDPDGESLFYVLSGRGRFGGAEWRAGGAIRVDGVDVPDLEADEEAEIYYLRLPTRLN